MKEYSNTKFENKGWRPFHKLYACCFFILTISCTTTNKSLLKQNNLASETSSYLLQHAENPVNWQPWDCKSSAKSGLILVKTKRVFSKSLILNYYENT